MSYREIVITRYGDRCAVLRPGTREGKPALVRRLSDAAEFELFYNDMDEPYRYRMAFYGLSLTLNAYSEQTRLGRIVRSFKTFWKIIK